MLPPTSSLDPHGLVNIFTADATFALALVAVTHDIGGPERSERRPRGEGSGEDASHGAARERNRTSSILGRAKQSGQSFP